MKLLREVLPQEFSNNPKVVSDAYKYKDVEVLRQHVGGRVKWPGTHKNVTFWVELANGKAVGWNQHPTRGSSFPVINLTK